MINWEITDDATTQVVVSDSYDPSIGPSQSNSNSYEITVDAIDLPVGDYTLSSWVNVDGNPPPTVAYNPEDGSAYNYADLMTKTHSFSVVAGTITGNEQISISGLGTYYQYLNDQTFDIDITGLDTNSNYDIEWRICTESYYSDGDWVDGNCNDQETYTEYFDSIGEMQYAQAIIGQSVSMSPASASTTIPLSGENIPVMWDHGITDGQGNNVESYTLLNGYSYHVAVMLTISGVTIESERSTPFAYGHSGWTNLYPETSGNILENMDYSFSIYQENLFSSNYVQSMINWEITDDATTQVVVSDSYDPSIGPSQSNSNSYEITVDAIDLPVGDYTLSSWVNVDGNPPPTVAYNPEDGSAYNYADGFSVIDPTFGTLASFSPSLPTITMQSAGWASIESTVDQLNNGDLHRIDWTIYEQITPSVSLDTDSVTWVSPPTTFTISANSNLLTVTGDLCYTAELYVGNIGPVDSQTDCWVQTAISPTSDTDNDGVVDTSDHCPLDGFQNDYDNDGCDDPEDTDADGLPDWWETLHNLDPNNPNGADGGSGDPDNDGLDNLGEYMTTTSPNNPDTDQDTVQDGQDMCPMTPGAGTDGCPTGNSPPTCDIFYSVESDGIVVQGDAAIPSIAPGTASETIELPEGDYYIIALCEDIDGDLVSISFNNQPVTTGVSSVTAGLLVNIDEDSSATQTITIDWSDGTTNLQTSITLEVEESSSGSSSIIPGFQLILAVISLLGAAILVRKNDCN